MDEMALTGVRVLEVGGGIAAGFAARLLAGYGADVVRTEGPGGLLTPDEELYLLPGKRRVACAQAELGRLALAADIVIEDGKPGTLAATGLEPRALRREKPELVVVSITPFGQDGPYAEFEATNIVSFAMGGLMSLTGSPSREPLVTGGSQARYLGGMNAFGAALTAYYGSLVHGEGDWVDISLQECAAGMLELYGPGAAYTGNGPQMRMGNHIRAAWGIYPCADGFAGVCALERQVSALFDLVGVPADERFRDPHQRPAHDDELLAIMYGWFAQFTKQEILALSPRHKVPFGAVLTPGDLLESTNLAERGFFDTVATPAGVARVPGRPFEGFPWRAGALHGEGADTDAVLSDWLGVRA
jgi:crotonobetainyl-CoA:carnitine CoA-transferase CaiB-like acyl-CoA transferase